MPLKCGINRADFEELGHYLSIKANAASQSDYRHNRKHKWSKRAPKGEKNTALESKKPHGVSPHGFYFENGCAY